MDHSSYQQQWWLSSFLFPLLILRLLTHRSMGQWISGLEGHLQYTGEHPDMLLQLTASLGYCCNSLSLWFEWHNLTLSICNSTFLLHVPDKIGCGFIYIQNSASCWLSYKHACSVIVVFLCLASRALAAGIFDLQAMKKNHWPRLWACQWWKGWVGKG